jgi:hypothetical protein
MTRLSYSCSDLDKAHMRMTYAQVRKVDHAHKKYEFAWMFMSSTLEGRWEFAPCNLPR